MEKMQEDKGHKNEGEVLREGGAHCPLIDSSK